MVFLDEIIYNKSVEESLYSKDARKGLCFMFKYNIRGENIEVTDAIRDYVEKKMEKLTRYFAQVPDAIAHVNVRVYPEKKAKVEVTLPLPYLTVRAEETSNDLYASIDLVVEKLERQIRKYKTKINRKIREKQRGHQKYTDIDLNQNLIQNDGTNDDVTFDIVRSKNLDLKPMDTEEAILQMNMLGHDFFIFRDAETNITSIVYRRNDGRYGLIATQ